MTELRRIENDIRRAMLADRHRLGKRLRRLRQSRRGDDFDRQAAELADQARRAAELRRRRRDDAPQVRYDESLPIHQRRHEIARAIREHQVVVVSGETGSGKSTQLPKICLELGRGIDGFVGHTQPRRIAARSIAARIADELDSPLGREVGYKIRFADATRPETYVKLMTDGILLAETQGDPFLDRYDTIILDEAHERSLNIDFLIGYLKRLLGKRRDLKLIITSATIDSARFARHFGSGGQPAPVIEVSGRTYPVDIRYRPIEAGEDGDEPDLEEAVLDAVVELARVEKGDVLIFMPTERHIHDVAKALRGRRLPGDDPTRPTEVLPLYARLPGREQQRVFEPHAHRRIVIATNVAESSLTVPGIRCVIDPGTARISRYSPRSKTQRLPIEAVSQASADQRAGRCGRVGPGICVRLFSEQDYEARDRFTQPEILRSNLASVILQTKALKLGEVERFPFLDPPKPAAVRDGYRTLFELGAIDARQRLTDLGRRLSRLPVDPRIGRMILAGDDEGCLNEVLIIAAALELRDPRERPLDKQQAADERHAQFADAESDFLSYLKLWDFYHGLKDKLSRNQLHKACRQNFLSYNRMREWLDVHRQLLQLADEAGLKRRPRRDQYGPIHRAILTGLLANVGFRTEVYEYTIAGGNKAHLWPGSGLFAARPTWVVAAELVETTKRYLRCCAKIDPDWIEPIAPHLVKRSYHDPTWERTSGSAVAFEKVSLFGLTVVPRRRVAYGPIDPAQARELLIQRGLVDGEIDLKADFLAHNRDLLAEMERLQAKLRRHDLLLGEWSRYEFYDRRIPEDVYDAARLMTWLRRQEATDPGSLHMAQSDVIREPVEEEVAAEFPDEIPVEQNRLPLDYRFEPGAEHDGVTLTVPLEALNQVDPERLGWLVPGLMEQKIAALIKSLPKPIRRKLVPAPDTARRVAGQIRFGEGSLRSILARALGQIAGERIPPDAFDESKLPDALRMNVCVVGTDGKPLAAGRDLDAIRRQLGVQASAVFSSLEDPRWSRDGIVDWDFDEFPEAVDVSRGGMTLQAYPALVDRGDSVGLRLTDSPERSARATRHGLRRLFCLAASRELRSQVEWLPDLEKMLLFAASIPGFQLKPQLAELIADRAFLGDGAVPRSRQEYQRQLASGRRRIVPVVQDVAGLAAPLFEQYHRARLAADEALAPQWQYAVDDVRAQIARLTGPTFLTATPWPWLRHYPRYFRAIVHRFDKLRGGGARRDRQASDELAFRLDLYRQRLDEHRQRDVLDPELDRYGWMLEEYRVSLFAQQLGTSIAVSPKRLESQWSKVRD